MNHEPVEWPCILILFALVLLIVSPGIRRLLFDAKPYPNPLPPLNPWIVVVIVFGFLPAAWALWELWRRSIALQGQ